MTIEFAELDIIGIFFEIIANDEQWGGIVRSASALKVATGAKHGICGTLRIP
jgi:hypothetical protein